MTIGDRIKEQRTKKSMTLLEVADQLGVKEATVQRYESGNIKNLKYETIGKIAEILNTTPMYLMGWEETSKKNQFATKDDNELITTLNNRPLLRKFLENLVKMDDDGIKAFITILGLKSDSGPK